MTLYVEKETPGVYGLIDTFINETVMLNTKTIYVQDITAVFKGFTNDFAVSATPNTIKLLGYFGYTEQLQPAKIQKRAKLFLNNELYREGIITLKNTSWINGKPSLFELEFSDGQRNLTETLGEDTLASLNDGSGNIVWSSKNIEKALQSIQNASGNVRWFVPLVSTERIFIIDSSPEALQTDNIYYNLAKPIVSEDVLLTSEVRPAMFISDILDQINKKYDININPTPYIGNTTQLTDLATMCVTNSVFVAPVKAAVTLSDWTYDNFLEERFDMIPRPDISAFELHYLGYGGGVNHNAFFDMIIGLFKKSSRGSNDDFVNANYVNSIEIWIVDEFGDKVKKVDYTIESSSGNDANTAEIRAFIGLEIFCPEGSNVPSTFIKPLVSVFVQAEPLAEWKYTDFSFAWWSRSANKGIINNVQPLSSLNPVNLFESLPDMKLIDFVKSIYTMYGYKKFQNDVLNDFYFTPKVINGKTHSVKRAENDLTPFVDLSKVGKKTNTKYDGYNLKHKTSAYQQNEAFLAANGIEYGQLKYPLTGKPKSEFKIETGFTAPVFNPVQSDADEIVYTFYPFGNEAKLNDEETRFIYDTITDELPIFYYNGVAAMSSPYAFVDTDLKVLKSIGNYHKISHKSTRIRTGLDNYITSLFNIISGDFTDQNTLYVQGFKTYIEDTLSGKKLIHSIDLELPTIEIQRFDNSQEIIIKETKYTVLESNISLTPGKSKLTLLNK